MGSTCAPWLLFPWLAGCAVGTGPAPAPTLIVLNKAEASVSFLDPRDGTLRATAPVGDGPHEAACTSDGRIAVVCNYGARVPGSTLTVLDVATGAVLRTIALERTEGGAAGSTDATGAVERFLRPHGIQFLPDDRRVVVTSEAARRLLVVDVGSGAIEQAIPTAQEVSHMVALSKDGTRAFVANIGSGSISCIDLAAGQRTAVVPTGAGAEGIAMHPSRDEVWVGNRAADTVSVVDTRTDAVVAEIPCAAFPIRVQFTRDGAHALVSCARSGDVAVIDVASRREVRRIDMGAKPVEDAIGERIFAGSFGESPVPVGILVDPDGRHAYVANTQADVLTVLDLERWCIARRLSTGREPDGMAWSALTTATGEPVR